MRTLLTLALLFGAASIAWGDGCGKTVYNPLTNSIDCVGANGQGAANVKASSVGAVTSLTLNTSSLNVADTTTMLVQCWTGTTTFTPVTITSLNPVTVSGGVVTVVTPNFSSTANVYCTASANSGAGPTGATGATGPQGPQGTAGANGAAGTPTPSAINAQSGTTYSFLNSDCSKEVSFNNAGAVAVTLPQAGSGGNFAANCTILVLNKGAGTVTITPTTSTLGGASSQTLSTGGSASIVSDGTDYDWLPGKGTVTGLGTNDTNIQLSLNNGIITPAWALTLSTARGGLGGNFSACTGLAVFSGGTVTCSNNPVLNTLVGQPSTAVTALIGRVTSGGTEYGIEVQNKADNSHIAGISGKGIFDGKLNIIGGGTQCVHVDNNGTPTGTGSDCGAGGGGGGTGNAPAVVTNTTLSASTTFTCPSSTAGTVVQFTPTAALSTDITSSSLASCTPGSLIIVTLTEPVGGGIHFTSPTGFTPVNLDLNGSISTTWAWRLDGSAANGVLVMGPYSGATGKWIITEITDPTSGDLNNVAGKNVCFANSADHSGIECYANGGTGLYKMILSGADIRATTGRVQQLHEATTLLTAASSPYTTVAGDSVIYCDATSGAISISLPATTGSGREMRVRKTDTSANTCTLNRAGSDVIDNGTSLVLSTPLDTVHIQDSVPGAWSRLDTIAIGGDVSGNIGATKVGKINGGTVNANTAVLGTDNLGKPKPSSTGDISSLQFAQGGGAAQAQTVNPPIPVAPLVDGLTVKWMPAAANSGPGATLAVSGQSPHTITKCGLLPLNPSDINLTKIAIAIYDQSDSVFQLINPQTQGCGSVASSGSSSGPIFPLTGISATSTVPSGSTVLLPVAYALQPIRF